MEVHRNVILESIDKLFLRMLYDTFYSANDDIEYHGMASKGWLAHPKANRLVTFDARFLHGVLPAHTILPSTSKTDLAPRRLTFMVGFWKAISATPRGIDKPGPGQPFPSKGNLCPNP